MFEEDLCQEECEQVWPVLRGFTGHYELMHQPRFIQRLVPLHYRH